MTFTRPYSHESEPSEPKDLHSMAFIAIGLLGALQFQWDKGNLTKNEDKHGVTFDEIKKAIKNSYGFIALVETQTKTQEEPEQYGLGYSPYEPPKTEPRFMLFSRTSREKIMMVVFTLRPIGGETYIRPISARYVKDKDVHRKLRANGYYPSLGF